MITRENNTTAYPLETTWDRVKHVTALPPQKILIATVVTGALTAIWLGSPFVFLAILIGVGLQYIIEYCVHRFLYHMTPPEQVDGLFKWLYKSHWGHHDFPNNPNLWGGNDLLFVPIISAVFIVIGWAVLILAGSAHPLAYAIVAVYCGAIPTYMTYEWAHVTAHAAGKKNWLERYISKEHAKHHFQDYNSNFHVNAGGIAVDHAFGTAFDRETYSRPEHIRTMGLAPDDARLVALRKMYAEEYNITVSDRDKAMK
jgi:hypothetical protein